MTTLEKPNLSNAIPRPAISDHITEDNLSNGEIQQNGNANARVTPIDLGKIARPRIAVSGGAVTGCFAAMIAHSRGFDVDLYEKRPVPTRQIQWSVRQAFLDALARIDPVGAKLLYKAIRDPKNSLASEMPRGSIKTISINNNYFLPSQKPRPAPLEPNPKRNSDDFLSTKPCFIITAHKLEKFLQDRIRALAKTEGGIQILKEETEITDDSEHDQVMVNNRPYRLAICAEGANSKTFRDMREKHPHLTRNVLSRGRPQIAAVVEQNLARKQNVGGYTSKSYDLRSDPDGQAGISLTGITVEENQSGKIEAWVVQDLVFSPKNPQERAWGEQIIEMATSRNKILSKEAADYLTQYILRSAISTGAIDSVTKERTTTHLATINGQPVIDFHGKPLGNLKDFILQHELVNDAAPSPHILFMGDAVGNAHWSVGGGMQIGSIAHGDRLAKLLDSIKNGNNIKTAARTYSDAVIKDSRSWLVSGYPDTCLDDEGYLENYKTDPTHPISQASQQHAAAISSDDPVTAYQAQEAAREQALGQVETNVATSLEAVSKQTYLKTLRTWLRDDTNRTHTLHSALNNVNHLPNPNKTALTQSLMSLTDWVNDASGTDEHLERELLAQLYVDQLYDGPQWPSLNLQNTQLTSLPSNLYVNDLHIRDCPALTHMGHGLHIQSQDAVHDKTQDGTPANALLKTVDPNTADKAAVEQDDHGAGEAEDGARPLAANANTSSPATSSFTEEEKEKFIRTYKNIQRVTPPEMQEDIQLSLATLFSWVKSSEGSREAPAREAFCDQYLKQLFSSKGRRPITVSVSSPHLTSLPDRLIINELSLKDCPHLTRLPNNLDLKGLSVINCAALREWGDQLKISHYLEIQKCGNIEATPDNLSLRTMRIGECPLFKKLGEKTTCNQLIIMGCPVFDFTNSEPVFAESILPTDKMGRTNQDVNAPQYGELLLAGLPALTTLPNNLSVRRLRLYACDNLKRIPEDARARTLEVKACSDLNDIPKGMSNTLKRLNLSHLTHHSTLANRILSRTGALEHLGLNNIDQLKVLPDSLAVEQCEISHCANLEELGENNTFNWLAINGPSKLSVIPPSTAFLARDEWQAHYAEVETIAPSPKPVVQPGSLLDVVNKQPRTEVDFARAPEKYLRLRDIPQSVRIPTSLSLNHVSISGCSDVQFSA